MDFNRHGRVSRTGFTVLKDNTKAEFDVVLVHGLGGHPYKTWTYPRPKSDDGPSITANNKHDTTEAGLEPEKSPKPRRHRLRHFLNFARKQDAPMDISRPAEHSVSTTTNTAKPSNEVYWPLHLLGSEEWCKNARVMVYGYESQVTRGYSNSNKNDFFAHAKDILSPTRKTAEETCYFCGPFTVNNSNLPLQVLRRSHESEEYEIKDIVRSTIGIIFMGTPHRASPDLAGLGETVRKMISTMFRVDSNSALLQTLGASNSLELELGRESFLVLWRTYDFRVKTFEEAYGITGVNLGPLNEKVVSHMSSTLDDPREHAETISANHMDICRFKNREDPGYRKISVEIKAVMSSYKKHDLAITSEGRDLLKSLYFPEMYHREKNIQRALEDTCNWLFATREYMAWRDRIDMAHNYGMIWIKGKPGAGKSFLVKEVSRRFRDHADAQSIDMKLRTSAAFFFNARGTEPLEKTALGVYRSLLHQVLQKDLVALSHLSRRYMDMRSYQGSVNWHEEDLQEFLMLVFATPESHPSTLFVDAMDECDEHEVRELLGFFKRLARKAYASGAILKICFSSRHYPNISIPGCPEVVVERHNRQDILRYIENEANDDTSIQELKNDLFEKSNGIFLWVVLVVTLLKSTGHGKSLKWLRHKLDEIPSQIEALFRTMFEAESEEQIKAIRLMHIMLYSSRSLTLAEIHLALAFSGTPYLSNQTWEDSIEYLETPQKIHAMIIDLSRGLLERTPAMPFARNASRNASMREYETYNTELNDISITHMSHDRRYFLEQTTYQFIHETVREFFLNGEGFSLLAGTNSDKQSDPSGPGHTTLAVCCVNYLNTADFAQLAEHGLLPRPLRDSKYPFLAYINKFMLEHMESAEKHGCSQETLITLAIPAPCSSGQKANITTENYGVSRTCKAVKYLLTKGADPAVTTIDQQNLLHLAARHSAGVLKLALACGLNVNARDRYLETPLHKASTVSWVYGESQEVVDLLVSHGADINATDLVGDTALHKAGLVGNSATFSALITAGADITSRNKNGWVLQNENGVNRWSTDEENEEARGVGDENDTPGNGPSIGTISPSFSKKKKADVTSDKVSGRPPLLSHLQSSSYLNRFDETAPWTNRRPDQSPSNAYEASKRVVSRLRNGKPYSDSPEQRRRARGIIKSS
ncbi:nacht and ankyrin domain protein [Rhypophila sp. PSN 637]